LADSSAESLCGASLRFRGFFFPILRQCVGFERSEKTGRHAGYFIDCSQPRALVCLRWFVKTADFPHELERSSSNLFGGDGRIEIEKGFDIPAHHFDLKVQNSQHTELLTRDHPFVVNLAVATVTRARERPFIHGRGLRCHERANRRPRIPVGTARSKYWSYSMR
jgi:hypothetical protein